jgi:phage shock protein B
MLFVAPIWVFMHYRSANRSRQHLNDDDRHAVEEMLETIDTLEGRIEALEEILDNNHSPWRPKA